MVFIAKTFQNFFLYIYNGRASQLLLKCSTLLWCFPPPGDVLTGLASNCWSALGFPPPGWCADWACQQLLKCSWLSTSGWCACFWCAQSRVYILKFYALNDFEPTLHFHCNGWLGLPASAEVLHAVGGLPTSGWCACFSTIMVPELSNKCWCARSWVYILNVYALYVTLLDFFLYWLILPWKCNNYHKYGWFLW